MEDTTGGAGIEEGPGTGPIDYARAELIARRIAASRLGGVAREGIEVEDVVQDVLLRFAELELDGVENWEAWVVTATKNRCEDVMAAELRHGNEASTPPLVLRRRSRSLSSAQHVGPRAERRGDAAADDGAHPGGAL